MYHSSRYDILVCVEGGITVIILTNAFLKNNSCVQLYNEEIRDLLLPGNSSGSGPGLDLREDPIRGPMVP